MSEAVPETNQPVPTASPSQPVPSDTSPVPTDTSPVPSDTSPVPTNTSPVPSDTSPVPTDTSPVPEASPPPDLRTALAAPIFSPRDHGPHLRVATPFTLPDGDLLTLFVLRHSDPPLLGDLGETLRWLRSHLFHDPPERQQQRVIEVCADLGVELHAGELRTHCRPHEPLPRALTRLAQACLRVADLRASLRPRKPPPFADEVEAHLRATLTARPLAIVRGDRIAGISATTWSVDFRVRTPERHLLIFLLASERRDHARKLAEHVVAACTDLSHLRKLRRTPVQFITIFDDRGSAWNDADERLVTPFATPFRWRERNTWVPTLEAPDDDPDLDDPNDEPEPFTLVSDNTDPHDSPERYRDPDDAGPDDDPLDPPPIRPDDDPLDHPPIRPDDDPLDPTPIRPDDDPLDHPPIRTDDHLHDTRFNDDDPGTTLDPDEDDP